MENYEVIFVSGWYRLLDVKRNAIVSGEYFWTEAGAYRRLKEAYS